MSVRTFLPSSLALVALAVLPGVSGATFVPGPNGKIVFASGRASSGIPMPAADDSDARIWVADYPSGTPVQVTTAPARTPAGDRAQHRHPNWSPDHTKIVYAAGRAFSGRYALWIVDLVAGTQTELVPEADRQDRPSWSPDGTRIAYGSGGKLFVKDVAPGSVAEQITNGTSDERPVWSPDGGTLYFNRGAAGNRDIFRKSPVTLAGAETAVLADANDDWQPAVSPDGRRLCFLRGPQSDAADLFTANVDGTGVTPFSLTPLLGDLNCVWSPDGSRILYTRGAFGAGELDTKNINGGDERLLASMNVPAPHFDGNADWATNFSPRCDARAASVAKNGFVSIPLSCVDPDAGAGASAPGPKPIDGEGLALVAAPAHGNVGSISNGRIIYTPAKDFTGTDTFTYSASDEASSGADPNATSRPATVTVTVGAAGGVDGDGGGQEGQDRTLPTISAISLSHRRWRRGGALARVARAPIGTIVSFRLSEAGSARLSFQRESAGRRNGGRCAAPTRANRAGRRCTRFVAAGSLGALGVAAGPNGIVFQGRLDRRHRLPLGTYRVLMSARDAAGNEARRTGPTFTIVARWTRPFEKESRCRCS
jgi:hypothetical protein